MNIISTKRHRANHETTCYRLMKMRRRINDGEIVLFAIMMKSKDAITALVVVKN